LGAIGRHDEALVFSARSLDHRRKLQEANPDSFVSDLAKSLSNHALRLGQLGRYEEAIELSQDAISSYEILAASCDGHISDLAAALGNHAIWLGETGRDEEAIDTTTVPLSPWP
jgi:tetratricopeptide (TPR) repeat protein